MHQSGQEGQGVAIMNKHNPAVPTALISLGLYLLLLSAWMILVVRFERSWWIYPLAIPVGVCLGIVPLKIGKAIYKWAGERDASSDR